MGLFHKLASSSMPLIPTAVMRRVASRYIAGETLDDALSRVQALAELGYSGILDLLGEHVGSEDEARAAAASYIEAGRAAAERGLDVYLSIKPTHLGLLVSATLAEQLYAEVAEAASALGQFVRVEMEDHTTTDATLELFETLRARFENVGLVLQARLRRTPDDIERLAAGPLDVRVVKGVYIEPEGIAHTDAEAIRAAFVACCERLFARGARVGLATHDEAVCERLLAMIQQRRVVPRRDYEFQVLLGVREDLHARLLGAGHPVRVYVPWGPNWRAYSQRRLQENPELMRGVMRQTLGMKG